MKLKIIDENNFLLFVINKKDIPALDEQILGDYLKKIFVKIKEKYNINVYGYYNVVIYKDDNYGMIIKLSHEELEYLSYYDRQIEMKIVISDGQVFYKIDNIYDIDERIITKSDIYLYQNELYLFLNEKIDFILLGSLIENSLVLFEDANLIKEFGEKIRW